MVVMGRKKEVRRAKGVRIDRLGDVKIPVVDEDYNFLGEFRISDLVRKGLIKL